MDNFSCSHKETILEGENLDENIKGNDDSNKELDGISESETEDDFSGFQVVKETDGERN